MDDAYLEKAKKRFWAKVKKSDDPDGCWIWQGCVVGEYGQFRFNGKTALVNRVSWELLNGPIPSDPRTHILQRCKNKLCVNPEHLMLEAKSQEDRFWEKVKKNKDGCWEWTANKMRLGYGMFRFDKIWQLSHRVSWKITNGPIPEGLNVLHRCDNPACVRPDHLFLGTQIDNIKDMVKKGRQWKKLTDKQVVEIRQKYAHGDVLQRELAENYNVSRDHICDIVRVKKRKGVV
jgi:hypothetical protein